MRKGRALFLRLLAAGVIEMGTKVSSLPLCTLS
jgi:hypothetical protein